MLSSPIKPRFLLAGVTLFLLTMLISTPTWASESSDTARDQAKKILKDKKFGKEENRPLSEEAQRLTRWLGGNNREGEIKPRSDEEIREESQPERKQSQATPPFFAGLSGALQVLFWLFIAALIGIVGFMIYKFISNMPEKKKDKTEDNEEVQIDWSDEEKVLETITDAQVLEDLSEKAEQEGHYDLALRYRFRAGLLRLSDMKVISFHPSITNAQWQLIIDQHTFNNLTTDFNDITYGKRSCDISHLERARSSWKTLISKTNPQRRSTSD